MLQVQIIATAGSLQHHSRIGGKNQIGVYTQG